jgi:hypothetical protein
MSQCHYLCVTTTCQTLRYTPHTLNEDSVIIIGPNLVANNPHKTLSHPTADTVTLTGCCNSGCNDYVLQYYQ